MSNWRRNMLRESGVCCFVQISRDAQHIWRWSLQSLAIHRYYWHPLFVNSKPMLNVNHVHLMRRLKLATWFRKRFKEQVRRDWQSYRRWNFSNCGFQHVNQRLVNFSRQFQLEIKCFVAQHVWCSPNSNNISTQLTVLFMMARSWPDKNVLGGGMFGC